MLKIRNGAKIQDGRHNVFIDFVKLFVDCFNSVYCPLFKKNFFLKIQNGQKIQHGCLIARNNHDF
jgi:hypothetical protein